MPERSDYMAMRPISADSHVVEPPNCYIDHIDPRFRDRAPRMIDDPKVGATFVIDGLAGPLKVGILSAAGLKPHELKLHETRTFDRIEKGAWDPVTRIRDMDRDGVTAEVIFPTIGMALYDLGDEEYKKACMDAYNRWLHEFVAHAPDRLIGIGQSPARSPESFMEDIRKIKALGFRGVMMPVQPAVGDYDEPEWDPALALAAELELPLCFHVLVSANKAQSKIRGSRVGFIMNVVRANQDVLSFLILGGVFDRHPTLKVVCVEADAGWLPHWSYRLDHAYDRFGKWLDSTRLEKIPSEYLKTNISFTFQDDVVAIKSLGMIAPECLMWATDYPHIDGTWPESLELLDQNMRHLDPETVRAIVHDNVTRVFGLQAA